MAFFLLALSGSYTSEGGRTQTGCCCTHSRISFCYEKYVMHNISATIFIFPTATVHFCSAGLQNNSTLLLSMKVFWCLISFNSYTNLNGSYNTLERWSSKILGLPNLLISQFKFYKNRHFTTSWLIYQRTSFSGWSGKTYEMTSNKSATPTCTVWTVYIFLRFDSHSAAVVPGNDLEDIKN